ncbi:MAG: rhomboid family intramembrane serine protease [Sedimentisphaerales bacterium]|nr:rhomboid family intramembrane serine protease [Sedimentisphaerales bacterium]
MGLYDRDYTRESSQPVYQYAQRPSMHFRKPSTIVGWLLLINITVFILALLFKPLGAFIYQWFSIDTRSLPQTLQLWRLITYQFLHDPVWIFHILFNMYALYIFGRIIEQFFGKKRFLFFYLTCGVIGGLFYTLLSLIGFLGAGVMVGASGSILGIIGACAVMFPQMKIMLFPVPIPISIRKAAIGGAFLFGLLVLTRGNNAGGHAAHLAGMAAGALYAYWPNIKYKLKPKTAGAKWYKKRKSQRQVLEELDRILEKVHNSGVHSLTRKEKQILRQATKLQQQDER